MDLFLYKAFRARRIWGSFPRLGFDYGFNKPVLYISVFSRHVARAMMASDDTREFKIILRRHEDIAQANISAIFVITSKVA